MRTAASRLDGSAMPRAGDVERGAVVGAGAHERQAQRHVHAVLHAEVLHRDQPVVVRHRDDHVELARVAGRVAGAHEDRVGRVAGRWHRCLRARAAAIAGRDDRRSSSPNSPPSPACGFRPATAMRGARPAPARRAARGRCGSSSSTASKVTASIARAQRHVDGDQHDAQLVVGQHHAHRRQRCPPAAASACSISVWPG